MRYWTVPVLIAGLIVTGCGTSQGQPAGSTAESTTSKSDAADVAQGVTRMLEDLHQFRQALTAKDSNHVKQYAEELEQTWESFEDRVKAASPDLYRKIEDPLGILQAGSKAESLDQKTLSDAANGLENALKELASTK